MLSSTPRTFVGSTTFTVRGMTCEHCRRAVTEEISAVAGVESVTVDLATGLVTVATTSPVAPAEKPPAGDDGSDDMVP
jgi:copper chaperone CopZ